MQAKNFGRYHGLPTDGSAGVSLRAPCSLSDQRSRWLSCDVECGLQILAEGSKGPGIFGCDFASKTFMANCPGPLGFSCLLHLEPSQIIAGIKLSLSSLTDSLHEFSSDEPVPYADRHGPFEFQLQETAPNRLFDTGFKQWSEWVVEGKQTTCRKLQSDGNGRRICRKHGSA